MSDFKIVEKKNRLACHALCSSMESAKRWIQEDAKVATERGYFMDKTLTPESFEIIAPAWYSGPDANRDYPNAKVVQS